MENEFMKEGSNHQLNSEQELGWFKKTITLTGIIFFNAVFVVGPTAGLLAVYLAITITGIAFLLSPAVVYSAYFVYEGEGLKFFVSLMLSSLGFLITVGMFFTGKWIVEVTKRYIKYNSKLILGGK